MAGNKIIKHELLSNETYEIPIFLPINSILVISVYLLTAFMNWLSNTTQSPVPKYHFPSPPLTFKCHGDRQNSREVNETNQMGQYLVCRAFKMKAEPQNVQNKHTWHLTSGLEAASISISFVHARSI